MTKPLVLCTIGTRPEAIKMAPVIAAIRQDGWADVKVLATAQHRGLLDQVLKHFRIIPDVDLDLMTHGQSLSGVTARIISGVDQCLQDLRPDCVLVQGDTSTVFGASLASFYNGIPIGHIEAGLRTGDLGNPFPEEANRILTSKIVEWHFAPTESSRANLVGEGVLPAKVFVTGNTVIDALLETSREFGPISADEDSSRNILVTTHRRENFGEPLIEILSALRRLAVEFPDVSFTFPVHPNPNVVGPVVEALGGLKNVELIEPLEYPDFVRAMRRSSFVVSDSGGVQEEAPALGKPVLVLRTETERPEAVDAGLVKLVGTESETIYLEAKKLLTDSDHYQRMATGASPYGDGKSAPRISEILRKSLT